MSARPEKIRALEVRLAELRRAQQLAEQRARISATKAERALETRRKVLAGAFLLAQAGSPEQAANLRLGDSSLIDWLRPSDRVLFAPCITSDSASAGSTHGDDAASKASASEAAR